ncbi:MAG: hypothetical protein ACK55I_35330, partial [bacterium]
MQAVALASVNFPLPHQIVVAIPMRNGGPGVRRVGNTGLRQTRAPVFARHRRDQRDPFLLGGRKPQLGRTEVRSHGEKQIMPREIHV